MSSVFLSATLLSAVAGAALVSSRPAESQVATTPILVDAAANRHPINPEVYGVNHATAAQLQELNVPLNRNGGNNTTRYNWQLNADNRANDWYYQSIPEASALPGSRGDAFIADARSASAQAMLTIPTIEWVAKLGPNRGKLASFSIAKYGAQTDRDWQWYPDAGNGISAATGQPIAGNDPNDANVPSNAAFQQGWVQQLVAKWGPASQGGLRYYILDNEPSIWFSTHRDVRPVAPKMEEIRDKTLEYGRMIKAQDPGAQVVGPEEWGWSGFLYSGYDQQWGAKYGWSNLPDRAAHGGMDYLPWLLDQLRRDEQATGQRVLDVFTVHYYPQGGEFSNDTSSTMQLRRNRSTRSLWDPNYVDESWIGTQVKLVPRLKSWVNTYYPGTRIGITEYNWGAEGHINGATTQADIYGIFGREGLDLAARWTTPDTSSPTFQAMKLYRNYDGNKSTFGDQSVAASVPNPDNLSAFAAVRTSDQALTVMVINKAGAATPISVSLANYSAASSTAQLWQLAAGTGIRRLADVAVSGGSIQATVPAQSISLLVVGGAAAPPPSSPVFSGTAGASPATVAPAASSTFSVNLTNTGAALTGGTVDLQVVDPAGAPAGQMQFPAQDFATGQSRSYTYAWTAPAATGTYTLKVRVLGADGATALYQNENAATITVSGQTNPDPTFTATATASPSSVPVGGTSTITTTITATGAAATGSLVDVEVYNSGGTKVAQQIYEAQDFTSGQSRTYTYAWTAPAAAGTYTVKLGVFSADWSKNYTWNNQAASITVTAVVAAPTFTATVTAATNPAPAQAPVALTATVKDTGGAATGAIVDVEIVDPSGTRVLQQIFSGQDFAAGQTRTYTFNWTPPVTTGKYTIGVGVFAQDWTSMYTWVSGAGTVDVVTAAPAPPSFTGTGTLSPASVTTSGAVTASATFTNSGGAATGTTLDLELYDSTGARVGQKTLPAQDFTSGQSRTVSWAFTAPAAAGIYTLKLGVFAADGTTQLYWNNAAGTLTVAAPAAITFSSSASVSAGAFKVGKSVPINVSVTATGGALTEGLVDIEIYNAAGTRVGQKTYSAQDFAPGQTRSYATSWIAAASGKYQIRIGVFGKDWTPQYHWNSQAGTITVK